MQYIELTIKLQYFLKKKKPTILDDFITIIDDKMNTGAPAVEIYKYINI